MGSSFPGTQDSAVPVMVGVMGSVSATGTFGLTQLLYTHLALNVLMQIPAGDHSSMLIAVHEILNLCLILSR